MLNLREPAERTKLDEWLAEADAFICNLAPESLKGLGLDGATLRQRFPHLVITLISGYGQDDPRTCMDTVAQCESGFALLNGDEDGSPRLCHQLAGGHVLRHVRRNVMRDGDARSGARRLPDRCLDDGGRGRACCSGRLPWP